MRQFKLLLISLLLLLSNGLFGTLSTAETTGKHLLWKVSSSAGLAYLLGSVHFGDESLYPLPDVIDEAFEHADTLVVEVNTLNLDPLSAAAMFAKEGMYLGGTTLKSQVRPETWDTLSKTAKRYGLMLEMLQLQKPWLVALSLSALEFKRAGYSETLGVDHYFLQRAKGTKPILELESLSQQVAIFGQFSKTEQEEFLVQTLRELDKGVAYLRALIDAWKVGNPEKIDALMNESLQSNAIAKRIYQKLLVERNVTMARKIEDMMATGKIPFVVVGAGHLVGQDGIVPLLENRGYAVQRF